ncbi:uncharacterized protein LOC109008247 [Juglans regia]|uniref:Uncharacterized protein LOC109008247 n=1 Tax=Juglans regia TaxID=51240 RepID=A0A6P9F9V5_JUGRE|nr:uncharacterized protein LOC109008247 [Juglans regia]
MWDSFAMAEGREEEASGALFHQIPYPFHTFGATGRRRLRLEPATEDDGTNSKEKPNGSECEVGICRWASAGENCDTQVPEKKVGASVTLQIVRSSGISATRVKPQPMSSLINCSIVSSS